MRSSWSSGRRRPPRSSLPCPGCRTSCRAAHARSARRYTLYQNARRYGADDCEADGMRAHTTSSGLLRRGRARAARRSRTCGPVGGAGEEGEEGRVATVALGLGITELSHEKGRVHARVLLAPLLALLLEAPNGDAAHHGRAGGDWRRPSAAEECTPLCSGALTSSKLQCYRLQQSDGDCPCFPATTAAAPLRPACAVVDEPVLVVEETTGSTYSLVCSTQEVAVPTSTAAGCES